MVEQGASAPQGPAGGTPAHPPAQPAAGGPARAPGGRNPVAVVPVVAGGVMIIAILLSWITVELSATDLTGGTTVGSATVNGLGSISGSGALAGAGGRVSGSFSVIVMGSAVLTAVLGALLTLINRRVVALLGMAVSLVGLARAGIEMVQDLTESRTTEAGVTGTITLNGGIYIYVIAAAVALGGFVVAARSAAPG